MTRLWTRLLLLATLFVPGGVLGITDIERGGPLSLIKNPAHRNYPGHMAGVRLSPYREGSPLLLKDPTKNYAVHVAVDLERSLIVVSATYKEVPVTYPWVAPLDVYGSEMRKQALARKVTDQGLKNTRDPGGRDTKGAFSIDLPVRFPKTLSRIIGQGANIQVSGSESITFSGESQYYLKGRDTESGGQRIFPELDMRQQLQVNLTGTIGEKVKVELQHNSESQVPLENRIKLRYEGYDDEIIQKVEIGNTNLALPGNQFVSLSSQQQGLFGVKMVGKMGKLDFTTVLSQQQGRTDRESFSGQSSVDTVSLNDDAFLKNRFFMVNNYRSIVDIRVFVDDRRQINNIGTLPGRAALFPSTPDASDDFDGTNPSVDSLLRDDGNFEELTLLADYEIDLQTGLLTMVGGLDLGYALAVWYTFEGENGLDTAGVFPDLLTADTPFEDGLVLKLIRPPMDEYRPPSQDPGIISSRYAETWYYQQRNIYSLPGSNISREDFEIHIFRKSAGATERFDRQNGIPYIQIMGLDLVDQSLNSTPDGFVDLEYNECGRTTPGAENNSLGRADQDSLGVPPFGLPYYWSRIVDFERGYLRFPDLRPFDPIYDHQACDAPEQLRLEQPNPVIYDNHDPRSTDSKYEIVVRYKTSRSSFFLGRSNILEGSEVVKLNGRTLNRGSDYRITYEVGQIEFLSDEALEPDADITVDFEYAPFLSQAQKSLIGAAASYNFSEDTKMSSIFMFKGKRTPFDRPRLGQEPSRIFVTGLSLSTEKNPEFLTGAVNAIPGITARDKSTIRMDIESAATFPNPNTKNAIYVDDMEGTAEVSSYGITRRQWDPMSIPRITVETDEVSPDDRYGAVDWYNPDYQDNSRNVFRQDLNPDLTREEGDNKIPVLEVALSGGTIGTGEATDAWGGIMRLVSKAGLDLKDRKFFEVWVNDFDLARGKMHIDMGLLGEDMMWSQDAPDGFLNTEDRNQDGVLDDSGNDDPQFDEDTGFDILFDAGETGTGGDPAGDNYNYDENNENDFSSINGPESNGFLDTEDLNNDGILNDERSYFRFTVDFETRENNVGEGATDGSKNWQLYRIPLALAAPTAIATPPTYDQGIKYVRIWFEDLDTTSAKFQIASLEVTGNRWLESGIQDTTGLVLDSTELGPLELFASGTINNKEEQQYEAPPVEIRVQNQVPEREQSLLIQYQNLKPGHSGSVFRALFEDEDYTRYKSLEFWLRKEEPQRDTDPYPAFYFRFGGDSLNFYEVIDTLNSYYEPATLSSRAPWRLWNLDLAELTQVKLSEDVDSTTLFGRMVPVRSIRSGRFLLRAVGEPSMRKVRRLTFGLSNPSRGNPVSGVLWVDDLRLTDVKGDAGFAARIGTELKLSDFASISADFRIQDKEFRRVAGGGSSRSNSEENPRSGSDDTDLNLRGKINFSKFMEGIGVNAPLSWGWSQSVKQPELKTASDIVLDDPSSEKTQKNARNASISLNRNRKSKNPFLYYTLDNMDLRLGLDRSENVNPTATDTTKSSNVSWSYRYSPRFNSQLQIFRSWKIDPLPRSGSINAERRTTDRRRFDIRSETLQMNTDRVSRSSYSFAMQPLMSSQLKTDFNFSTARDHIFGEPFSFAEQLNKGLETNRAHEANVSYTPGFRGLSWLSPRFSYNTKFIDDQPPSQRALTLERDEATGELDTLSDRRIHNVRNNNTTRMDFTLGIGRLFSALPGGGDKGGRPGDGGRGPVGEDANEDSTKARRGGLGRAFSPVKSIGSRIGDITGSVNLVKQSNFADLIGRPGLSYQFGLEEEVDQTLQFVRGGQQIRSSTSRDLQIRGSSSIRLVKGMNLRASYNRSNKRNQQTNGSSAKRTVTWPDLQYSWDGLEEIWQLKRFFKSSSLSIGYTQRKDEGGKTLDKIETERISKRWDPLLQVEAEWINKLKSQFSIDKSEEINRNFLGSTSENISRGIGFNGSLSFQRTSRKRVNIPILGKGRKGSTYNATTTFRLAFRYASSKEEDQTPYRLNGHTRDISMTPSVQWSWLQNLSGNLELRLGERRNLKNENRSTRTIGASISALFKF